MIFHSDDYGYKRDVDVQLLHLLESGKLQSVSVLATMASDESLADLKALQDRHPTFAVALHANIVEGKSLGKTDYLPTLVSHHGVFYRLPHLLMNILTGKVHQEEIGRELEYQMQRLLSHGLQITAIDSHQHTHALSPVAEAVAEIAAHHGIEHIRSYRDIKTYTLMARLKYNVLKAMAASTFTATHDKIGLPASWSLNGPRPAFMSWESGSVDLAAATDEGITYVIHPHLGYDTNTSYNELLKIKNGA